MNVLTDSSTLLFQKIMRIVFLSIIYSFFIVNKEFLKFRQLYLEDSANIQLIERKKLEGVYDVRINPFLVQ